MPAARSADAMIADGWAGAPAVPGLVVRHLRAPDDYPAMNRIANEARAAMGSAFTTTDAQLAAFYDHPGHFVATRDVAVFEQDGRIVGYARGGINQQADGLRAYEIAPFLDPTVPSQPVFAVMLDVIERHLRALAAEDASGDRVLETFGGDSAPEREAAVLAAGFEPVRHGYAMVRPHVDDLPDAPLPKGLEIREVQREHLRAIWDASAEAFRDAWGTALPTEADYEVWLAEPVESDPSLWRVAWDGDQVAGQVRGYISAEENARFGRLRGYTENISVRRPWRRRGLARALIAASFPLLRARGMTEAALSVDTENVSGALRVYERCGFVPVSRATTYRKPFD